ncbi:unknown [Prevotella sp. CAG:891]|nr:unknown [Prevotella sp. CAG:891]
MIPSTGMPGSSLTIFNTTFCVGAGANPNTANACTASSTTGSWAARAVSAFPPEVLPPIQKVVLPFNSTNIRCAAFGPIPFTLFSERSSPDSIMFDKSAGVKADRAIRAICPPMPDTEISNTNRSRSILVANP